MRLKIYDKKLSETGGPLEKLLTCERHLKGLLTNFDHFLTGSAHG